MAKWIWTKELSGSDTYAAFRGTFEINEPLSAQAEVRISADSDFILWINGIRQPGTQFPDFPHEKTYTAYPAAALLHPGRNLIAVTVHHVGHDFLTGIAGAPGLWLEVRDGDRIIAATDESWKAAPAPGWRSGMATFFTSQLGFVWEFDARRAVPWQEPDFDDSAWLPAQSVTGYERTLAPRPLPALSEKPLVSGTVCQSGELRRDAEGETFAHSAASDWLCPQLSAGRPLVFEPLKRGNGWYVIFDFGKETVGFITLDLDASAGTVIDLSVGEHLDDGRVRCQIAERNMTDRYVCAEGKNAFTASMRRVAGRYFELHFTSASRPPLIRRAGIIPVERPLPNAATFLCEDHQLERIHDISQYTLQCCMHDHFEDCPWREQGLYAYDSRNQALYGYYLWGNYDFAAASFDLLGKSLQPNGYLTLTAPGKHALFIPSFTLAWISALYEWHLHSGRIDLLSRHADRVRRILDGILSRPAGDGLFDPGKADGTWNFFEWVDGLNNLRSRYQAPFNLYLCDALRSGAKILETLGQEGDAYRKAADEIGRAVETKFWDEAAGCYQSVAGEWIPSTDPAVLLALENEMPSSSPLHEHTQALMLMLDLVPQEKMAQLTAVLNSDAMVRCTYSSLPYWMRAMMKLSPAGRAAIPERILHDYLPPVASGATTMWEVPAMGAGIGPAVSLCHGWSALPAWYAHAAVLGITPLAPGFRKFRVAPCCGTLHVASGEIPTPYGKISIAWERDERGVAVKLDAPKELEAVYDPYPEFPLR